MASSEADSRLKNLLSPTLLSLIKNASWRKHSKLASDCKSLLDLFSTNKFPPPEDSDGDVSTPLPGPLNDLSLVASELVLSPLISACTSHNLKLAEPSLDCIQKLVSHGYLRGEADPTGNSPESALLASLVDAICKCTHMVDESIELLILKTLLSAVTSASFRIHGDSLLLVVRTCYDIYLDSKNVVNQTTAKASLVQMLVIVFRRMEADSSTVPVHPIVVAEVVDAGDEEGVAVARTVQGFITRVMMDIDGVLSPGAVRSVSHDGAFETRIDATVEGTNAADLLDSTDKDMLDAKYWEISMYKSALEDRKGELAEDGEVEGPGADREDDLEVRIGNKLRRDAFLVFRALCKLSMKTPPKDALSDPMLMRAKIVALELLKILLENAGAIFRTSDRYEFWTYG